MPSSDIDKRFDYHPSDTPERVSQHVEAREATKALANLLDQSLPPGREKALALTKLEEALFWANAAIARAD